MKTTTNDFILKARKIHGDKYEYSKVDYVKNSIKVTITCRVHGDYSQLPLAHLQGKGCLRCSGKKKITTPEFIQKAKLIHGDEYDYSQTVYENSRKKLSIRCGVHGEFTQRPDIHLNGHGCPDCAKTQRPISNRLSTHEFIQKAKAVHGDKYDYSQSEYVDTKTKVLINCELHGDFNQQPPLHLQGSGCPGCAKRGFNPSMQGYLYILRATDKDVIKIGITNNPKQRFNQLANCTPFGFNVIECYTVPGELTKSIESVSHEMGEPARLDNFHGSTEWFKYDSKLLNIIRMLCESTG